MKPGLKSPQNMIATALAATMFLAILNSCRKEKTDDIQQSLSVDIESLKAKFKDAPQGTKYVLNLPGKGYYGDINGNKIEPETINTEAYHCPGDPGDDEFDQQILSSYNEFTCGQGFNVTVTYELKVWYNLEYDNPNNPSQLSVGKLRLYNSSNQIIWQNTTMPISSIVLTGTEPHPGGGSFPDYNVYEVSYTTPYIPAATFNSSTDARPSLFIYTDCSVVPTINIGYSSQQSVPTTANYTVPYSRTDKVWFNPNPGGSAASVLGVIAVTTCGLSGYIYPDQHDIYIDLGNPAGYQPIRLWRSGSPANNSGTITNIDIWFVTMTGYDNGSGGTTSISAGTYPVRYMNRQLSTYGGPCTSEWVYENWYIN